MRCEDVYSRQCPTESDNLYVEHGITNQSVSIEVSRFRERAARFAGGGALRPVVRRTLTQDRVTWAGATLPRRTPGSAVSFPPPPPVQRPVDGFKVTTFFDVLSPRAPTPRGRLVRAGRGYGTFART
ncbi:hypothetical protein EVAR_70575_1 [Eumeta japonica]|uniref:Uncharacterized protein n=1 Tax=Eumeta variegata TaxID=151549 RepID=A0A4C1TIC5_EUMVA|nr:hypothetical protein EVAR_70575_1 [Eumeta japonica]